MGPDDISRELICLAAMRQARADFFSALERMATEHLDASGEPPLEREQRKLIRSEGVAQIAEFFYILREGGVSEPRALEQFLRRHNEDMQALLDQAKGGYTVGGLSPQRVRQSIFSERQIDYVLHECAGGELRLDQLSLQRIFTQSMSFESCRKLLVLLADCGFLNRREFNQVLISSKGILETLYSDHLGVIVRAIAPEPQGAL